MEHLMFVHPRCPKDMPVTAPPKNPGELESSMASELKCFQKRSRQRSNGFRLVSNRIQIPKRPHKDFRKHTV